jgi:hypothetical protein
MGNAARLQPLDRLNGADDKFISRIEYSVNVQQNPVESQGIASFHT